MEMKPTPIPWRVFNENKLIAIMEANSNDEIVHWAGFDSSYFHLDALANAVLIVEAVNNHARLLAENALYKERFKRHSARERVISDMVFQHIKHGDEKHQNWLRAELDNVLTTEGLPQQKFDELLAANAELVKALREWLAFDVKRNEWMRDTFGLKIPADVEPEPMANTRAVLAAISKERKL